MLSDLSVNNVVLIDKLNLSFDSGLTVLTGETGAGKSILLDALSLCLGAKTDTGLIRHQTNALSVCATFDLNDNHPAFSILTDSGIEAQNPLILRRQISIDGKSKCFINDNIVSLNLLKTIGQMLVEVHSQFATYRLLDAKIHRNLLDDFGQYKKELSLVSDKYQAWKNAEKILLDAENIISDAKAQEDYLKHLCQELEVLNPQKGEEETLTARRSQLMNCEKITQSINRAYQALCSGMDQTITSSVHNCIREIEKVVSLGGIEFEPVLETLQRISLDLDDAVEEIERSCGDITDPTAELEEIEGRLFALKDLARKHQTEVDNLPEILKDFQNKLSMLEQGQEDLITLKKNAQSAKDDYIKACYNLSLKRKETASILDKRINKELPDLKLNKASFKTQITESSPEIYGTDNVEFLISTNSAQPYAPLSKIASGGELARFMLALKVNLKNNDTDSTLIFDEIDTGIGGSTATAVGERLKTLSKSMQVFTITHSAQIAALGDQHLKVEKSDTASGTITTVKILNNIERQMEIARIVSGKQITDSGLKMAQELLGENNDS